MCSGFGVSFCMSFTFARLSQISNCERSLRAQNQPHRLTRVGFNRCTTDFRRANFKLVAAVRGGQKSGRY